MSRHGTRGPKYVTDYSPQEILKGILKTLQRGSPKWSAADYRKFQNLRDTLVLRIVPAPDYISTPALKPAQKVRFAPDPRPGPASRRNHEKREREINLSNSLRLHAARMDALAKQTAKEAAAYLAALTDPEYVRAPNDNANESFYLPEDSETYNHLIRTDPTTGVSTAAENPLKLPISFERHSDGPPKDANTAFYWPGATEYIHHNARRVDKEQHTPSRSDPRGPPKVPRSPRGRQIAEDVEANDKIQKTRYSGRAEALPVPAVEGNRHAPVGNTPEDDSGIVLEDSILSKADLDAHNGFSVIGFSNGNSKDTTNAGVLVRDFAYGTQSQPAPPTGPVNDAPVPLSRVKKVPVAPSSLRRPTRPRKSETTPEPPTPSADRKRARGSADDEEATRKKILTDADMAKARKS